MDLSCIISSGDLELYVLGMLPEAEMRQIDQLISIFPEVKQEVDRISEAIQELANNAEATPSPSVKDRLFQEISGLQPDAKVIDLHKKESNDTLTVAPPDAGQSSTVGSKKNYLAAASIIGLIVAGAAIIFLINNNNASKNEIAAMQQKLTAQQEQTIAYNQLLKILQDKNFTTISLEAVAGKPQAEVKLFWNKTTAEVFVVDFSLPSPPPQKQYQLWAIVDGKPVNAGMLTDKKQTAQKMQNFTSADAFAITLEKAGGSDQPTLEEMYVMGKTS